MAYLFTLDSVLRLKVKGIGTSLALSLLQHNSKRHSRYFTLTNNEPRHEKNLFSGLSTRYKIIIIRHKQSYK